MKVAAVLAPIVFVLVTSPASADAPDAEARPSECTFDVAEMISVDEVVICLSIGEQICFTGASLAHCLATPCVAFHVTYSDVEPQLPRITKGSIVWDLPGYGMDSDSGFVGSGYYRIDTGAKSLTNC